MSNHRRAIIRVLYLAQAPGLHRDDEMFDRAWAWMLEERNAGYVPDSIIGQCARKADAVLRLIDAAGCEVVKRKG